MEKPSQNETLVLLQREDKWMNKKRILNITKDHPAFPTLLICYILVILLLGYAIYSNINAITHGNNLGQQIGSLTGKAIGSFEGITKGREQGTIDGKIAGLSAEDTITEITNEIHKINNLEVLVASVKVNNIHTIGDSDIDYAAIYLLKGDAVFSIDLSQANIDLKDNELLITLPLPKGELYIDQSRVEKVAEYQKHFFTGSAEAGFDAYLNSMEKVYEATAETLDNYDVLIEAAKASAKKQVLQLTTSVLLNQYQITIGFMEDS